MFLMIDNYDSFVYNLIRYFEELNEEVIIYRNDKITLSEIEEMDLEGIIISPGPKSPKESGLSLEVINRFKGQIPILGICLGHQCIGYYFGGEIIKGNEPIHGKVSYITHNNNEIFKNIKNPLKVTRYHSLVINDENIPRVLEVSSRSEDGVIMGVKHKEYHIYGLQFHPEAEMTEEGHKLLKNFIDISKSYKEERKIDGF